MSILNNYAKAIKYANEGKDLGLMAVDLSEPIEDVKTRDAVFGLLCGAPLDSVGVLLTPDVNDGGEVLEKYIMPILNGEETAMGPNFMKASIEVLKYAIEQVTEKHGKDKVYPQLTIMALIMHRIGDHSWIPTLHEAIRIDSKYQLAVIASAIGTFGFLKKKGVGE